MRKSALYVRGCARRRSRERADDGALPLGPPSNFLFFFFCELRTTAHPGDKSDAEGHETIWHTVRLPGALSDFLPNVRLF